MSIINGPSKHITWEELACKDGTAYPEEFRTNDRVYILAEIFEDIRSLCGSKPIQI